MEHVHKFEFHVYNEASNDFTDAMVYVTHYAPEVDMKITGWGFGDANPPEPEEIEYLVTDVYGNELKVSEEEAASIEDEIRAWVIEQLKDESYECA